MKEVLEEIKCDKLKEKKEMDEWKKSIEERLCELELESKETDKMGEKGPMNQKNKCDVEIQKQLIEDKIVARIDSRMDDLEIRSRRSNLVFKGLKDREEEQTEHLKVKVQGSLRDVLKLEEIEFIRLHGVGKFIDGIYRVIIGKLVDERMKCMILKKKSKLRNLSTERIFIEEDFSYATRTARMTLRDFGLYLKRHEGGRFYLSVDTMKMNRSTYTYDNKRGEVFEVEKSR